MDAVRDAIQAVLADVASETLDAMRSAGYGGAKGAAAIEAVRRRLVSEGGTEEAAGTEAVVGGSLGEALDEALGEAFAEYDQEEQKDDEEQKDGEDSRKKKLRTTND